ncbi:hypothetical protein [Cupriavidus basilensis]|uniref:hypothetical protein n=1 Tax=Cupriavidus basilensis TaxID=68895 RepID=UPI0011461445|nr:hypothetical protein [Cupriavidus basilensis]
MQLFAVLRGQSDYPCGQSLAVFGPWFDAGARRQRGGAIDGSGEGDADGNGSYLAREASFRSSPQVIAGSKQMITATAPRMICPCCQRASLQPLTLTLSNALAQGISGRLRPVQVWQCPACGEGIIAEDVLRWMLGAKGGKAAVT